MVLNIDSPISISSVGVLNRPKGLAYDSATGLLYISCRGIYGFVVMNPATGVVVRTINICKEDNGLLRPGIAVSLALDGHGNILLADVNNSRVVVFNLSDGTPITAFPTLPDPRCVFVDAKGTVIVGGLNGLEVW